jgi:hypothetical protein
MCENEFYQHPAPRAHKTDSVDFIDLLFALFI